MKPGLVGGAALGALILLSIYQAVEISNGNLWAVPGLIWDVIFSGIGAYQVFSRPSLSSADGGTL